MVLSSTSLSSRQDASIEWSLTERFPPLNSGFLEISVLLVFPDNDNLDGLELLEQ